MRKALEPKKGKRGNPTYSVNAYQRVYRRWKTAQKALERMKKKKVESAIWKVLESLDQFNIE